MVDKKIKKILPTFRKSVLLFIKSNESKGLDCHGNKDLSCACALASRSLAIVLNRKGYKSKLIQGIFDIDCEYNKMSLRRVDVNHCWVELNNHIIDITASQFGDDKIIITEKKDSRYTKYRKVKLNSFREFRDWPAQQIPRRKYVKQIIGIFEKISRGTGGTRGIKSALSQSR